MLSSALAQRLEGEKMKKNPSKTSLPTGMSGDLNIGSSSADVIDDQID